MSFLLYKNNKFNYTKIKKYPNFILDDTLIQLGGDRDKNTSKNIIDEKKLLQLIDKNTKSTQRALYEEDGKLVNNIANKGLNPGEMAIRGGGEYNGLVIRAVEYIKPILTDARVSNAVRHLSTGDIQKATGILRLNEEIYEYGIGIIYGVVTKWLENNDIPVPKEYTDKAIFIDPKVPELKKLLKWIEAINWSPVMGKFEIVEIGHNKYGPIVPESWVGEIYPNAVELHKQIDTLEWRRNKPPVTFCVINEMDIIIKDKIQKVSDIRKEKLNIKIGISMLVRKNTIESSVLIFKNSKEYKDWLDGLRDDLDLLIVEMNGDNYDKKIMIVFYHDQLFEKTPIYIKKRTVGLLVSMVQKLIRRGPKTSQGLVEVLTELWRSPGYNLPEQQFLRVNASRQLAWRLLITAIEDVQAFVPLDDTQLSIPDLAILAIIGNADVDVQFNKFVFDKLLQTALGIQSIDNKWKMLDEIDTYRLNEEIPIKDTGDMMLNSFIALKNYIPSREWDHLLITLSFNYINKKIFVPAPLSNIRLDEIDMKNNKKNNKDALLAGMDMHPYPNLLLLLQSSLPFLPYNHDVHTTRTLKNFIWDYSSAINFRLPEPKMTDIEVEILGILKSIQGNLLYPEKEIVKIDKVYETEDLFKKNKLADSDPEIPPLDRRIGFILLFGKRRGYKYKNKKYDIIMAGYDEELGEICKVKYVVDNESKYLESGELRDEIEMDFLKDFSDTIVPDDPPVGYRWKWGDKKKIDIRSNINQGIVEFYADNVLIEPYDATNVMVKVDELKPNKCPRLIKNIIKRALYIERPDELQHLNDYEINMLMRKLHELKFPLFDWLDLGIKANLSNELWRCVLVKLYNSNADEILIGPVDGSGHSLLNSINYLYEGTIWRILNMLSMLYSQCIFITIAVKSLKFRVDRNTSQYLNLIYCLKKLTSLDKNNNKNKNIVNKIEIVSKLWPHQEKTKNKILKDIFHLKRRGFADASHVGAGKSLCALAIMAHLYNHNIKYNLTTHQSFIVMVPTLSLYKTWNDEIIKHCKGFHVVFQQANGDLTDKLQTNSLLITTMARTREHPLNIPWIFVVIDESLSVMNKSSHQSEEAYKQVCVCQYSVFLLSATMFRTRLDKLMYMIKMLETGLPLRKDFLDAILAEIIAINIPNKTRKWYTTHHPFELSKSIRKEYDEILSLNVSSEKLYVKLQSYLFDNFDYVVAFSEVIKSCEKKRPECRCLIYTRSKKQADLFADELENVSRFPDISGKHLTVSVSEGSYGINNLIYLNTIISQLPNPDIIPQQKGRLDRPGQKNDILYIEYIYVNHTIDMAGLLRLELENQFKKEFLLPLSDFYDVAVGRKKFNTL